MSSHGNVNVGDIYNKDGSTNISIQCLETKDKRLLLLILSVLLSILLLLLLFFWHASTSDNQPKDATISFCNVPKGVAHFTGREYEMRELRRLLEEKRLVAIVGCGGIGKTELAQHYAHEHRNYYKHLIFIHAETDDSKKLSLFEVADAFKVKTDFGGAKRKLAEIMREIYEKLSSDSVLVVFDNAERNKDVYELIPRNSSVHVLITSQIKHWGEHDVLPLSVFGRNESAAFLGAQLKNYNIDAERLEELIDNLGGYPLVIYQVCGLIKGEITNHRKNPNVVIREVNAKFSNQDPGVIDRIEESFDVSNYEKTILRIVQLSIQRIEAIATYDSSKALDMLYVISWVSADGLRRHYFYYDFAGYIRNSAAILEKYSLINIKDYDTYDIHRLVQFAARKHLVDTHGCENYAKKAFVFAWQFERTHRAKHERIIVNNLLQNRCNLSTVFAPMRDDYIYALIKYSEFTNIATLLLNGSKIPFSVMENVVKSGNLMALRQIRNFEISNPFSTKDNLLLMSLHHRKIDIAKYLILSSSFTATIDSRDADNDTALIIATRRNWTELTQLLMEKGADVECVDSSGRSVLHWAAIVGNTQLIHQLLIQNGLEIDRRDRNGASVLASALENCRKDAAELLIRKGAEVVQSIDNFGRTLLHFAAFCGYKDLLQYFIERGVDVDRIDHSGETALSYAKNNAMQDAAEFLISKRVVDDEIDGVEELHRAVIDGNVTLLTSLIDGGVDIDSLDANGESALLIAIRSGSEAAANFLIERGARVQDTDLYGRSALHWAAARGSIDLIRKIVNRKKVPIDLHDYNGESAFVIAAKNGRKNAAMLLIKEGASVQQVDDCGKTALHWAARYGFIDMSKRLIDAGVDIDRRAHNGETAFAGAFKSRRRAAAKFLMDAGARVDSSGAHLLHWAVANGDCESIDLLLDNRVFIDGDNEHGDTALVISLVKKKKAVADHLISKGADIRFITKSGRTILHLSVLCGHTDLLENLIDEGLDLNWRDKRGETALVLALRKAKNDAINVLIAKGSDLELSDYNGRTPFHWAAFKGHIDAIEHLASRGVDIDKEDRDGNTALSLAVQQSKKHVVKILIAKGANISSTDNAGRTPLHWAASNGHDDLLRQLINHGAVANQRDAHGETALVYALMNCKERAARLLIDEGVRIDTIDRNRRNALHWAARCGFLTLLRNNLLPVLNINQKDDNGETPVAVALRNGNVDETFLLISKGADLQRSDITGRTLMHWAALRGSPHLLKELIHRGLKVDQADLNGETPLAIALRYCSKEAVYFLLAKSADVRSIKADGTTALHWAAFCGYLDLIPLLINKHSLRIDQKDEYGDAALEYSLRSCDGNAAALLIAKGADIEVVDNSGRTLLHWAVIYGCTDILRDLIDRGLRIDQRDDKGETALTAAVKYCEKDAAEFLIVKGANVSNVDNRGRNLVHWAAMSGCIDLLKVLIRYDIDINMKDADGNSALALAGESNQKLTMKFLFYKGAEIGSNEEYILSYIYAFGKPQNKSSLMFMTPGLPFIPAIAVTVNIYLIFKLSYLTLVRFVVWMSLGFVMYFYYGIKHSSLEEDVDVDQNIELTVTDHEQQMQQQTPQVQQTALEHDYGGVWDPNTVWDGGQNKVQVEQRYDARTNDTRTVVNRTAPPQPPPSQTAGLFINETQFPTWDD